MTPAPKRQASALAAPPRTKRGAGNTEVASRGADRDKQNVIHRPTNIQANGNGPPLSYPQGCQQAVIQVPSKATLRKYGLDAQSWLAILESQGHVCAICKQVPKTGRFVTDHAHVKGWKKMKPEKRRTYVRGLCCWWCNKNYIGRSITVAKATNVVLYLQRFEARCAQ
jgi:hypothetical protein